MLESPYFVAIALALGVAHVAGLLTAAAALMSTRTPQGSVAWILSLLFAPWLAVPIYWLFGRSRFDGYVSARQGEDQTLRRELEGKALGVAPFRVPLDDDRGGIAAVEHLARLPVLSGNKVELLEDGETVFAHLFEGLEAAQEYALVQFYIVRDDALGREFHRRLVGCAARGVRVYFLADRIGSHRLPDSYMASLREAGVEAHFFTSSRGRAYRFQVNFRNHRKVTVVDGSSGWVGGLNVGDEYLGKDPSIGHWRDTHLELSGPAVLGLQLTFLEDWFWVTGQVPDVSWSPKPAADPGQAVLIVPSGPADAVETAGLFFQHAIHSAVHRIWISSPYFVPDRGVMSALKLAAYRGVDVRILIPKRGDAWLIDLAGFAFFADLIRAGVRIFRYRKGFLHHKMLVLDGEASAVGTANLDNRSFRLNFEITAVLLGADANRRIEAAFEEDFQHSEPLSLADVIGQPLGERVLSRLVYLFAPIL
jgi:cardiolipin synthase A/B